MPMATWDDVRRAALALPEASEREQRGDVQWRVKDKLFAWERPLRQSDLDALGLDAQQGPVLAIRVADEGVKRSLVAEDPAVFFTTPHFDGYAVILVRLEWIGRAELEELLVEAWLDRAPKRLAREYLAGQ